MTDFDINSLTRDQAHSLNPYIDSIHFSMTLSNVCEGLSVLQDMDMENGELRESTYMGLNSHCAALKAALGWEADQPSRTNKLDLASADRIIQSRDDLSFTSRTSGGNINNWDVPHDKKGNWHEGLIIGEKYFDEVRQLALFDEREAYHAIEFAMNSPGWIALGWGIEMGFAKALAKAAMLGMRELQNGAIAFDEKAHNN